MSRVRLGLLLLVLLLGVSVLASCRMPGDAAPVVKIGLIAPFEGLERTLGYAVLAPVKEALAAANASGRLGHYRVALVALNDDLSAGSARAQAEALIVDDAVLAVIGPVSARSAAEAVEALSQARLGTVALAPLAEEATGVISLCPSVSQIRMQLAERAEAFGGMASPLVLNEGAETAVARAVVEEAADRQWVGGPDMLRSWFIGVAGSGAEGSQAAACTPFGFAPQGDDPEEAMAALGRAAAETILRSLAVDIGANGHPTRRGIALALQGQRPQVEIRWYEIREHRWRALPAGLP